MRAFFAVLGGCAVALLGLSGQAFAAPVLGDPCPNGDVRQAQGVAHLPGCMALEMVSPPQKDGQPARINVPEMQGGLVESRVGGISPDGNRILFFSQGALGRVPALLHVTGDPYVASREQGDRQWATSATAPANGMTFGSDYARPGVFSADFTSWLQTSSSRSQYEDFGIARVFQGGVGSGAFGLFSPLLERADPLEPGQRPFTIVNGARARGMSVDRSLFVLRLDPPTGPPLRYIAGDPLPSGTGSVPNGYVARQGQLSLLSRDATGKVWGGNCGADLAGGTTGIAARGSISPDGSHIYFTTRPAQAFDSEAGTGPACATASKARIMVRDEAPAGPQIAELIESECDRDEDLGATPPIPACGKTGPNFSGSFPNVPNADDTYLGGSADGSKVYFRSSRQLTDSDTNGMASEFFTGTCVPGAFSGPGGCDLYLYDADEDEGERLTQITEPGTGTVVPQLVTFADDGSRAYFTSTEVLTAEPGPEGKVAEPCPAPPTPCPAKLYLYDAEVDEISFVAPGGAGSAWAVPVLGDDPSAGGDGRRLLFTSTEPLTADDTDSDNSDVFRYDAETEQLVRISKAAAGGSDNGDFGVDVGRGLGFPLTDASPVAPEYATRGRWVSDDGDAVGFTTAEGLVAEDSNGAIDSYLWRDGELVLLPGTSDPNGVLRDQPLVSPDGDTVAFQTAQQLLPRDGDTAADVYALRTGGGFPEPVEAVGCVPDGDESCQGGAPDPPPAAPTPSVGIQGLAPPPVARNCARPARRAQGLSNRAKRLRRNAARVSSARRTQRLRKRSMRFAKQAKRSSSAAKRCRRVNRGAPR